MSAYPATTGKRIRDSDDDVYLDNFYSSKRYLTEVIALSLNALRVGDAEDKTGIMEARDCLSRTEAGLSSRACGLSPGHELLLSMDSPMSDDSDDSVSFRLTRNTAETPQPNAFQSPPTPASPNRISPPPNRTLVSLPHYCSSSSAAGTQLQRQRSHDMESRLPPSPSDSCQAGDLRRAALMRACQIRVLSPGTCGHHVADQEKSPLSDSNREDHGEDNVLGSPVHGTMYRGRVSSSARSLLLDDKTTIVPSQETTRLTSLQKRGRGDSSSIKQRCKLRRFSKRKKSTADVSDTDSSA